MVQVEYNKIERGPYVEHLITLDGHSDHSDHGADIVCSAVSILIQTLVVMLDKFDEDMDMDMDNGQIIAIRYPALDCDIEAETAFLFVMEGMELLSENYPDQVSVT